MDAELLPPRMRAVYLELLRGLSEKEIANAMQISVSAVHHNVKAIYVRAGVHSRAELLALKIFELQCELHESRARVVAEIRSRVLSAIA